jgi:hypothetical protein
MPLRGENKRTLLNHTYNPTGMLLEILRHRVAVYKRYKRRYPKSRYDIGGI